MSKNDIIQVVVENLMKQRADLNDELVNLNHNETSFNDRRITLESAIGNIDMQVQYRIADLES